MTQILGQEGESEFVINRQNSKLQILSQENNYLQEDIKDLNNALKYNKQALRLALEQQSQQNQKVSKNQQTNYISASQFEKENQQNLNEVCQKFDQENQVLVETLNRVMKERNEGTTKEQINEETTNFYKDVNQEYEDKVLELRRIIQDKEYTIQNLERKLSLPDKDGVLLKIREVISPSEQSLSLHSEIENLKELNEKLTQSIQSNKNENEILQSVNRFIVCDIKTKEDYDLPLYQRFFKEMMLDIDEVDQKKVLDQNQNPNQLNQVYKPANYNNQQHMTKSPRSPRSRTALLEKMETTSSNLQKFKKLYFKSQKNNQILLDNLKNQQKHIEFLTINRDTLIKANLGYQQKQIQISKELQFYKFFYNKYMLQVKNSRSRSLANLNGENYSNKKSIKKNGYQDYKNNCNNQIQSSNQLIEKMNDQFKESQKKQQELEQFEKQGQIHQVNRECCMIILKNLNQEISQLKYAINILINSNKETLKIYKNRSISNPLDYFTIEIDQKLGYQHFKRNLAIIAEEEEQKYVMHKGDKRDKNAPFLLDMSVIQGENQKKKGQSKVKSARYVQTQKKFLIDASFISNDGGDIFEYK